MWLFTYNRKAMNYKTSMVYYEKVDDMQIACTMPEATIL